MRFVTIPAAIMLPLVVCSCAEIEQKPTSYHLINRAEIQFDMGMMAEHLLELTELTIADTTNDEIQRESVLSELNQIERIASSIDGGADMTNYSVVNRYMGSFLYDVGLAKEFAQREPPNYVPANRLIKSCLSCHESI